MPQMTFVSLPSLTGANTIANKELFQPLSLHIQLKLRSAENKGDSSIWSNKKVCPLTVSGKAIDKSQHQSHHSQFLDIFE